MLGIHKVSCPDYPKLHLITLDCPNGFVQINNRCFRHLSSDDTFENHLKNCDKMMGRLLSVETMEANDPDFLVAQKIMDDNSKTTIFLGNLYIVSILPIVC